MRFIVFEIWLKILRIFTNKNYQKFPFFVPKDAQCSESNAEPIFIFLRSLVFEIDYVLKIHSEMRTFMTASATLCEPDSETLSFDTQ